MKLTNLTFQSKRKIGLYLLLTNICLFIFPGNIQCQSNFTIDGYTWGLSKAEVKSRTKYEITLENADVLGCVDATGSKIYFTFKYGYLNSISYFDTFYKKKKEQKAKYNTSKTELILKYGSQFKIKPATTKDHSPSNNWFIDSTEICLYKYSYNVIVTYNNKGTQTGIPIIEHTKQSFLVYYYKLGDSKDKVKSYSTTPITFVAKDDKQDVITYKLMATEDLYLFFTDGILSKIWYNNQCKSREKAQTLYKILKSELVAQYKSPGKEVPSNHEDRLPNVYWMSDSVDICLHQLSAGDVDITYTNKRTPVKIKSTAISSIQRPKTKIEFLSVLPEMGGTFELTQKDCQVGSAPIKLLPITIQFSIINGVALADIKEYNLKQAVMTYDISYNTFTAEKSLGKLMLGGVNYQIKWFGINEKGGINFLLYRYTVDRYANTTQTEELICTYLGKKIN